MKEFKNQIRWLLELIKLNIKSNLEYRTSFWMQVVGMAINNCAFLVVWYLFFQIFHSVNGWKYQDMIGLNGFVSAVFGLCFFVAYGMRRISKYITFGQLDAYLVLPKSPLIQILFAESYVSALGDLLFGIISLVIYCFIAHLSLGTIILLPILFILACCTFTGFNIVGEAIAFWIPNSNELTDALFEFMLGPSLYPNSAFTGAIRIIFTFIIPAIVVGGMPVNILLKMNPWQIILMICLSIFWLLLAKFIFDQGLKRYESGNLTGAH
ncbi:MAG: ABC-2 family transporter protein [bacterium]